MTLREITKMAVIKFDIPRDQLPDILVKEVEAMEAKINTELTGKYESSGFLLDRIEIGWSRGEWSLSFLRRKEVLSSTIKIRAGKRNDLGLLGGELFLFPGREIVMDDFKIDFERRMIKFFGTCSSFEEPDAKLFKSTVSFSPEKIRYFMKIESEVIGTEVEKRKETFLLFNSHTLHGSHRMTNSEMFFLFNI